MFFKLHPGIILDENSMAVNKLFVPRTKNTRLDFCKIPRYFVKLISLKKRMLRYSNSVGLQGPLYIFRFSRF